MRCYSGYASPFSIVFIPEKKQRPALGLKETKKIADAHGRYLCHLMLILFY